MTLILLRSIGITLGISAVLAGTMTFFNVLFWPSFIIITIAQIIVWQIVKYVVDVRAAVKNKEIESDLMKQYMANEVVVPCSGCKKENLVPIQLNKSNNFKCSHCDLQNVIYISLEAAQVTTPVDSLKVDETIKVN